MKTNKHGFTLVELLIVIVVIAILAAISIVAYNGIQERAHKTAVWTDLSSLAKKLELYKITNGAYPYASTGNATADKLDTIDFEASAGSYAVQGGNLLYITDINASSGGTRYALLAVPKMGTAAVISSSNTSVHPYTGSAPFPGSGYGDIAEELGFESLASGNTVAYNAYSINNGFRIWD